MKKKPTTVAEYLAALPEDRREALNAVREVILDNLDPAIAEGIQYGMIGYFLPHSVYPDGYHCDPKQPLPFASLASQKNHMGIYLFCVYTSEEDQEWFRKAWLATGKKLDMGKSCVRFKKLEDVPLDVVGRTIRRATAGKFIAAYEASLATTKSGARALAKKAKKKAAKTTTRKKVVKKKVIKKKVAKKKAASKKVAASGTKAARRKAPRKKTARK
jgi:hypothetical protein